MATRRNPPGSTNRSKGPAPRKPSPRTKGPIGPAPGPNASAAENRAFTERARDRGYAVYKDSSGGWAGEKKPAPRSANYKGATNPSQKRGGKK